jgi:hypothetical protein
MHVTFAAHRCCVAEKFSDGANGGFDVRLCLLFRFERLLFAQRDCG